MAVRAAHGATEKRPWKGLGKVEELTTNPFVRSIWNDAKGRSSGGAPMAAGDGEPIPAGEGSSEAWEGAGEVEDKGRKVLVEGIDERGPEEGDQRKGATAERADEWSSSLIDGERRKEEMTTGLTTR